MHKVDSAGATANNEFTNGDPALGIARTRLEAKWMNALQREIVGVIEQSGITLSDADDAQVRASVMLHVLNIAALRELPVPAVAAGRKVHVYIEGFAASDDGGDGVFRWEASSSAVEDSRLVVTPSTKPMTGRWLRVHATPYYRVTPAESKVGAPIVDHSCLPLSVER